MFAMRPIRSNSQSEYNRTNNDDTTSSCPASPYEKRDSSPSSNLSVKPLSNRNSNSNPNSAVVVGNNNNNNNNTVVSPKIINNRFNSKHNNNNNTNNNVNTNHNDNVDDGNNTTSILFKNWLPNVGLRASSASENEPSTSTGAGRFLFQRPSTTPSGNQTAPDGAGNTFVGATSEVLLATLGEQCASTWRWFRSWALRMDTEENCSNPGDEEGITESSIRISHSLPDLNHELEQVENTVPNEPPVKEGKKVLRQITLPSVPTRHQTFQRQLSRRLDFDSVEFKICKIKPRNQYIGEVKPELYSKELMRQPSTDSSDNENMQYCGKLYFSLRYDFELDALIIKVLEAHDLPVKDVLGSSDPYVKVFLLPDRKKKFQTKVHRKNLDPVFNETFIVSVGYDELRKRHLQFSVYDFDRFSRHDLIGQVMLKNLFNGTDLTQEIEYTMNIMCPPEDKQHLGEIMLSLCYLPTAGRLTVTVVKARHLKAMDITGSSDPYVKVYLICGNKRIRKKRTTVKRSTLNPLYNEALTFDVPSTNIEDVSLLVKVVDYDRIGSDELMGYVGIGTNVIGTGRDHWLDMLDNPRNPVAQWYTLMDSEPGPIPTSDSFRFNCLNGSK